MNPDLGYPLIWLASILLACGIAAWIGVRLAQRWEDQDRDDDIARILRHRYRDHTTTRVTIPDYVPEDWSR